MNSRTEQAYDEHAKTYNGLMQKIKRLAGSAADRHLISADVQALDKTARRYGASFQADETIPAQYKWIKDQPRAGAAE